MPKCPKCGKEISTLNVYAIAEIRYVCQANGLSEFEHYAVDEPYDDEHDVQAMCPHCDEVLFGTTDEAMAFLQGQ